MAFRDDLRALLAQLDPQEHAPAIRILERCKGQCQMEDIARIGWLEPENKEGRLRLVKHGSGTFLVVRYVDGWTNRVAMQLFR